MSYAALSPRLHSGRPLVVDADLGACLRARGVNLDYPGALGALLRRDPETISVHHAGETALSVDVLSALTADTTPRALAEVGMEHRSALLTGQAVELAQDVALGAKRPVAVAAVLGSDLVTSIDRRRFEEEVREHALRICAAAPELVLVRGMGSPTELCFATAACVELDIPSWSVVDLEMSAEHLEDLLDQLAEAGADAVLFEAASIEHALERLARAGQSSSDMVFGVMLAAGPDAVRGFPAGLEPGWVNRALELVEAGARVIGGGAGTTQAHSQALAAALRDLHPSVPPMANGAELGA